MGKKRVVATPRPPSRVLEVPGLLPRAQAAQAATPPQSSESLKRPPGKKKKKGKADSSDLPSGKEPDAGAGAPSNEAEPTKGDSPDERPAPRVLQIPGQANRGSEKRRFMSDKVSSIRSKPPAAKQKARKGKSTPDQEDSAEFKKALKDVLNFVMPQLGKSERIQYEKAKIRALGGTPDKPIYEPYASLQRRKKAEEAARQRRLAEEKLLGVSLSATQQRRGASADGVAKRKKEALLAKKRRKENDILGVGAKESKGMVIIPKNKAKSYA